MRRRDFITLLGGAAAWPLAARAQQPPAVPVVGWLNGGSASGRSAQVTAFLGGLKETGFTEGSNVRVEFRWADFQYDRLPDLAADFVRRQVAVIVTTGAVNATLAAKAATATIPIVFLHASDPIEAGLVPRLNRPGGNITGVTSLARELEAKRLDLLRELLPDLKAVGLLINPNNPNTFSEVGQMQSLASAGGWRLEVIPVRSESELDAAFAKFREIKTEAFLTGTDQLLGSGGVLIATLAISYAIPGIHQTREFAEAGGLISYGASLTESNRQGGIYVGRILKGEKPADLPVLQPTKFELVINLKTAKTLGLTVPNSLLAIADEVIE